LCAKIDTFSAGSSGPQPGFLWASRVLCTSDGMATAPMAMVTNDFGHSSFCIFTGTSVRVRFIFHLNHYHMQTAPPDNVAVWASMHSAYDIMLLYLQVRQQLSAAFVVYVESINPLNASCSKLLLFQGFSAILV